MSTGESSQELSSSQECVDIAWEDDESLTIKEEPSDEVVSPLSEPEYDALVSRTFLVLRITNVEKKTFTGNNGQSETDDVCNIFTIDPLGRKRMFSCWKEKAQQMHDYIT
jgi:hypothetical protein